MLDVVMKLRSIVSALVLIVLAGCSKQTIDKETKADLISKAKDQPTFAGVTFSVNGGIVSLSGTCATKKDRSEVEASVRDLAGVKEVIDNIVIAPVVIGTDRQLKQSVDSAMKEYPSVMASVRDSVVVLSGQGKDKDISKIYN